MEKLNTIQNNQDPVIDPINDPLKNSSDLQQAPESSPSATPADDSEVQNSSEATVQTPVYHTLDGDSFNAVLIDAERRGYNRGRNEALKEIDSSRVGHADSPDSEPVPTFLSHLRPGFWD